MSSFSSAFKLLCILYRAFCNNCFHFQVSTALETPDCNSVSTFLWFVEWMDTAYKCSWYPVIKTRGIQTQDCVLPTAIETQLNLIFESLFGLFVLFNFF